jgi:hypothetical protein
VGAGRDGFGALGGSALDGTTDELAVATVGSDGLEPMIRAVALGAGEPEPSMSRRPAPSATPTTIAAPAMAAIARRGGTRLVGCRGLVGSIEVKTCDRRSCYGSLRIRSSIEGPVRAFRATRDPQDHHEPRSVVDDVDDPKVPDAEAPELGPGKLGHPGRTRVDREGQDRTPQSSCLARRQAAQLTLGGGRDLDSMARPAHSSCEP